MHTSEHTRVVTARLAPELAERLERVAREHGRSVSGQLRVAVREHLAREDESRTHERQEVAA